MAGGGDIEPRVEPADVVEGGLLGSGDDGGRGGEGFSEEGLGGVLAEAQHFHRCRKERGKRRVGHAREHGGERGTEDAALECGGNGGGVRPVFRGRALKKFLGQGMRARLRHEFGALAADVLGGGASFAGGLEGG